jgi:hypothetical protein
MTGPFEEQQIRAFLLDDVHQFGPRRVRDSDTGFAPNPIAVHKPSQGLADVTRSLRPGAERLAGFDADQANQHDAPAQLA